MFGKGRVVLLISKLLKNWPCTIVGETFGIAVTGITESSVNVKKGFIFVVRRGRNDDGASFIAEAIEGGAVAIVVDRPLLSCASVAIPIITVPDCRVFLSYASARFAGNPSERLTVIAVTGTNGKTTVTHFIGQLLRKFGIRAAVIGTTGVFVDGIVLDYKAPEMTTLPAEYLHPLLRECADNGVTHIVLEASSLGLSTDRLEHCEIDVGILLNIGSDHYDEHGGKQNYIDAKKKLMKKSKQFIVNMDDEICVKMSEDSTTPCVYFGTNRLSDVYLSKNEENVRLGFGNEGGELRLSVPGDFNQMNAAAAISALLLLGFRLEEVLRYVVELKLPEGRLQRLEQDDLAVYIDFAHTPDAIEAVLHSLSEICRGRLITVFGCGGNRDKGKRAEMGELAVFYSSNVIVTSDNPRNEDPLSIIKDIVEGFGENCRAIVVEPDRKRAIQLAISNAVAGDIVLIAGKGHEKTQQTADGVYPFSDLEEAEIALFDRQIKRGGKLLSNQFTDA